MMSELLLLAAMAVGQSGGPSDSGLAGEWTAPAMKPLPTELGNSSTQRSEIKVLPTLSPSTNALAQATPTSKKSATKATPKAAPPPRSGAPKSSDASGPVAPPPRLRNDEAVPTPNRDVPKAAPKAVEKKAAPPAAAPKGAETDKDENEGGAKDGKTAKDEAREPILPQLDVPYRTHAICIYDPFENANWFSRWRTLWLWRSNANDRGLLFDAAGNQVMGVGDFDLGNRIGQELAIGHMIDTANALEGTFLWLNDANASQIAGGTNLRMPFQPAVATFNGINAFEGRLESSLFGFEFNYLRFFRDGTDHPWRLTGIFGFRQFTIEEKFRFTTVNPNVGGPAALFSDFRSRGQNGLYGGQVGGRLSYREVLPGLNFDSWAKFGMAGNVVDTENYLFGNGAQQGVFQASAFRTTRFSTFVDLNFDLVYKLKEGLHLTAGYQFYYFEKVARGADQLNYFLGQRTPNARASEDMYVHGFTAGLRFYWGNRADPSCHSGCCTPYVIKTDCGCK